MYERSNDIASSRYYYNEACKHTPKALKWKVWMIAARIEAHIGNEKTARGLIEKSCD